jgi:alcohol dehydrogenase class IV
VPTTAGTGAEVTRNAVLRSTEHGVKASLRSATMLPTVALVDPELTYGVPPAVTAASGLDALTQLIEPFVSTRASALTDGLCREAIPRSGRSLRRAFEHPDDPVAREDLALASLFGGLALANAGLGAVHGFAAPIGGSFPRAPHGAVCGRLLPIAMEVNVRALRERALAEPALPERAPAERSADAPVLERFDQVARLLTGDAGATAETGVEWIAALVADLAIPGLASYGIAQRDLDALVDAARKASSMRANPIVLTDAELRTILERAL